MGNTRGELLVGAVVMGISLSFLKRVSISQQPLRHVQPENFGVSFSLSATLKSSEKERDRSARKQEISADSQCNAPESF